MKEIGHKDQLLNDSTDIQYPAQANVKGQQTRGCQGEEKARIWGTLAYKCDVSFGVIQKNFLKRYLNTS